MKNKILKAIVTCTAILSVGCASVTVEDRISSSLKAYEYNDIAARYMARPTFLDVEVRNGEKILHLTTNEYGKVGYDPELVRHIYFQQKNVDSYVSHIDKFLKWEKLAVERSDQLTKEIGRAESANGTLVFDFHSGNTTTHFLTISTDAGITLWPVSFPKEQVITLKQVLINFRDETYKKTDTDIYN